METVFSSERLFYTACNLSSFRLLVFRAVESTAANRVLAGSLPIEPNFFKKICGGFEIAGSYSVLWE